jgi:putative flavoprotein involved in K+ transport
MRDTFDTVVVGAGQAGLAVGHFLARQGREFTILDAAAEPAAAWRERWDSLTLFTPARYDSLPGLPFPGDPEHHPTRDEVAEYLTDYAAIFGLPVELGHRVRRVAPAGDRWIVEAGERTIEASNVVVATGPFQVPRLPADLAERLGPSVQQLHSVEYRRPAQVRGSTVLVVGGGNTGYQIAEELAGDGRAVHLAVGSRQMTMPNRLLGRDIFTVLEGIGAMRKTADSRLGKRLKGRDTLVGYGPKVARRQGVTLHGRATAADAAGITFADGGSVAPDAIVWATGFTRDHSFVQAPVFAGGEVVQRRGVTEAAGLYFLGLPWMHTRGSALLGWVQHDAEHVANHIDLTYPLGVSRVPIASYPPTV